VSASKKTTLENVMANLITPPPELVEKWVAEIWHEGTPVRVALSDEHIAIRAAQWGADQELEACCEWLENQPQWMEDLRAARRPKPPSLKEQALGALCRFSANAFSAIAHTYADEIAEDFDLIRRAVEALDD